MSINGFRNNFRLAAAFQRAVVCAVVSCIMLSYGEEVAANELGASLAVTSDYTFDGVSQTVSKPALQLGAYYEHESGLSLGLWGSNVDLGPINTANVELDYTLSYNAKFSTLFSIEIGASYYQYLGNGTSLFDFNENHAKLTFNKNTSATIFYADDRAIYGRTSRLKLRHNIKLASSYALGLETTFVDDRGSRIDWFHYRIGLTRSFNQFNAEISYENTNIDQRIDPQNISDGRFIVTIRLGE